MAQVKKRGLDGRTLPVRLEIVDVKKIKGISKHYVYLIHVTCQNGLQYYINRRYRQFDELQHLLEHRFPVEAGEFHQRERILPTLPGKIYLSRSAVRDVTDKRLPQLNQYLKHLFSLPDNIRYDSIVNGFTRQTPQDRQLTPPSHTHQHSNSHHDSTKTSVSSTASKPNRPGFPAPSPPSLVRKKTSVPPPRPAPPTRPSPPTKPPLPTLITGPRAKTLYEYTAQYNDELSFTAGVILSLEKDIDSNWIQCRLGQRTGLVPLSYITVIQPLPNQQHRSSLEESDEWDSEEDQLDDGTSYISCCVDGITKSISVASDLTKKPTLFRLRNAIQDHLGRRDFVISYQDNIDSDLIEIVDQSDLDLMTSSYKTSSWQLFITKPGDYTPFNTHPYK